MGTVYVAKGDKDAGVLCMGRVSIKTSMHKCRVIQAIGKTKAEASERIETYCEGYFGDFFEMIDITELSEEGIYVWPDDGTGSVARVEGDPIDEEEANG